jgi:D-amino-acid dehydrogenase
MPSPGSDVVVVGGGLVGASLAYELVSAGADTVLVDRRDPGRATDAGAGILSPETNRDPDPEFAAFGLTAAHHYQSLVARLADDGVTDVGFDVTGSLLVAERPGDDAFMEEAVRLIEVRRPGLAEEVDPGDVSRFFPPLGPVRRALLNPAARRVDGRVLNAALLRGAASRGLREVATAVTGLDLDGKSGTARGVVTAEGTLTAGAVVIAGGAWSAQMADALGVSLPVVPLKGQIVHLTLPATYSTHWTIVQPVLGFYLVPWPDGRVACGGTMEAQAGFDIRPTADGLHQLLRECLRTAPGLAQATVGEVRVGLRPATPDDRPVIGPIPGWSNVHVATGHGAEGLLLGPYSGRVVARTLLEVETSDDPAERTVASDALEAYSSERFCAAG